MCIHRIKSPPGPVFNKLSSCHSSGLPKALSQQLRAVVLFCCSSQLLFASAHCFLLINPRIVLSLPWSYPWTTSWCGTFSFGWLTCQYCFPVFNLFWFSPSYFFPPYLFAQAGFLVPRNATLPVGVHLVLCIAAGNWMLPGNPAPPLSLLCYAISYRKWALLWWAGFSSETLLGMYRELHKVNVRSVSEDIPYSSLSHQWVRLLSSMLGTHRLEHEWVRETRAAFPAPLLIFLCDLNT